MAGDHAAGVKGGATAFPTYDAISKTANIESKSTVARALAVLRATRWLTLCARLREKRGHFRGNVFALHDDPLPLVDTLHLDAGYMQFLQAVKTHGHVRLRAVTRGILASTDEDREAGPDLCAVEAPQGVGWKRRRRSKLLHRGDTSLVAQRSWRNRTTTRPAMPYKSAS